MRGLRALLIAAALTAGAALAGCETMSAEECAAADWGALGFNDAANNGADNFGARAESCGKKGFTADQSAYARGFAGGMEQFCQPPNGFQFARRGGSFGGACPAPLQRDFYAAYADGRRVYEAEHELESARSQISSLESRRREIDDDIRDHERAVSNATTDEDRRRLRDELEHLRHDRREANDDLQSAQQRAFYAQRRVGDLHYEIGDRWVAW